MIDWARVAKTFHFEAGHRLPYHGGKCRRLHGHSYVVVIEVSGEIQPDDVGSSSGMVLDFHQLSAEWDKIEPQLDHRFLIYKDDVLLEFLKDGWFASGVNPDEELFSDFTDKIGLNVVEWMPTAENIAGFIKYELEQALVDAGVTVEHVRVYETATSWAEV